MMILTSLLAGSLALSSPTGALTGDWGGPHVLLSMHEHGAEVEFDCGHGTLDDPPAPGKNGEFSVSGRYVAERGGPTLKDAEPSRRPARYFGTVAGERMTLEVAIEGDVTLGPFALTRGGRPRLHKCR